MQQLDVRLSIPIPKDSVLISKVELKQLKQNELAGVYWTMGDLERRTKRKSEWLKERILYQSRFRQKLDTANGGFVYYPKTRGETWAFQASKMAEFLDKYFHQIFD
ncbi:DUF771 domain-containing protein [Numidum massiliense]|uniref:DUF771 domain-containing protein n=1 Tax=Numidum massiliense TaxID=1522315 RepID=UPI0006D5564B|nr:DUF771 domain-containing protein [Numidum massiliense]